MNKKLLLGAALMIGMGPVFTSCVDSTESASVTAVREAKAEQLKSIAELNRANAKAAEMLAQAEQAAQAANQAYQEAQAKKMEAESDYLRAQAALLQAQAEVEQAKAAAINAQTEADQKRLDAELKEKELQRDLLQAELDKKAQDLADQKAAAAAAEKLLAAELARLEAELQTIVAKNNILNQAYQNMVDQAYRDAEKYKDDKAAAEHIAYVTEYNRLIGNYKNAANALFIAQRNLADAKVALMKLEAGLASVKETIQGYIKANEKNIIEYQTAIDAAQAVIDALDALTGQETTPEMVADAEAALEKANDDLATATANYKVAAAAQQEAKDALSNGFVGKLTSLINKSYGQFKGEADDMGNIPLTTFVIEYIPETEVIYDTETEVGTEYPSSAPSECVGKYALVVKEFLQKVIPNTKMNDELWDPETTTYYLVSDYYTNQDLASETVELGGNEYGISYPVYTSNYNLYNDGAGLNKWLELKEQALKAANPNKPESIKKELDKAIADVPVKEEAYKDAYAAWETADAEYKAAVKTMPYSAGYDPKDPANTASDDQKDTKLYNDWADAAKKAPASEPAETATAEEKAAWTAAQEALKALNAAVEATNKAYATLNGSTDSKGQPVPGALETRDKAYQAWNDAISKENLLTEQYNRAINGDDTYTVEIDAWKADVAEIIELSDGNQDDIDAANAAEKALAEATADYYDAYYDQQNANSNFETLRNALFWYEQYEASKGQYGNNNSYTGGIDDPRINWMVANAKKIIAENEPKLADEKEALDENKAKLADVEAGVNPINEEWEYEVAYAKADVEDKQARYDNALELYNIAQKEFESFVKSEEPAE